MRSAIDVLATGPGGDVRKLRGTEEGWLRRCRKGQPHLGRLRRRATWIRQRVPQHLARAMSAALGADRTGTYPRSLP